MKTHQRRAGAAVGVYLGGSHVRVVAADLAHHVFGSAVRELRGHTAGEGLPAAVEAVEEALRAAAGEVLIDPLRSALRAISLPLVGSNTEVMAAALGAEAGALGGVALVLRESERLVAPGVPLTAR